MLKAIKINLLLIFLLNIFAGCTIIEEDNKTKDTIEYNRGNIEINIAGEKLNIFQSVKEAVKQIAEDKKFICNKLIVFKFTKEDGSQNLLCRRIVDEFRNQLDAQSQTISPETYKKLEELKRQQSSNAFNIRNKHTLKGFLEVPQCMLTGSIYLQKKRKVINVLAEVIDTMNGTSIYSTNFGLYYSDPDIKDAYNTLWDDRGVLIKTNGAGAMEIAVQFEKEFHKHGYFLTFYHQNNKTNIITSYILNIDVKLGEPFYNGQEINGYVWFNTAFNIAFIDTYTNKATNITHDDIKDNRFYTMKNKPELNAKGVNGYMNLVNKLDTAFFKKLKNTFPNLKSLDKN